ncbi:MAG: SHOCT domain-containing protein [Chloroflexota bacterium]
MMTGFSMGFNSCIWMILFWIAIIGGSIWLLTAIFPRTTSASNRDAASNSDSLEILKQRYARGELSKEEFDTMRHTLEQAQV